MSFWDDLYKLGRPVIGMSPMDGVTDAPFRYMVAKYGRPDVIFTEFVNVDGLHYAEGEKRERMLKEFVKAKDLVDLPPERFWQSPQLPGQPEETLRSESHLAGEINQPRNTFEVAQVFGNKPEFFVEAAKLVESLGFDGIDINMGCPAKNVAENGCGAGLIRTPKLAQEIVLATKNATKLPVSVKTRIGVSSVTEMEEWIEALCRVKPANITLHGRTLKQLYQGEADWGAISRAAKIVHKHGLQLLGNGDIDSLRRAQLRIEESGVDGVLIGRAAEGNPGVFRGEDNPSREQRLSWAIEHAQVYEVIFKPEQVSPEDIRWFLPMRKHLAWYAHGFPGAVELRMALMRSKNATDVANTIEEFLKN